MKCLEQSLSFANIQALLCLYVGRDSRNRDPVRAGRSEDRIPLGTIFFAAVQTSPGTQPFPCGSFPWVHGQSVALPIYPHLAPKLKKE